MQVLYMEAFPYDYHNRAVCVCVCVYVCSVYVSFFIAQRMMRAFILATIICLHWVSCMYKSYVVCVTTASGISVNVTEISLWQRCRQTSLTLGFNGRIKGR
jgi:hypothetical protein